MEGTQADMIQIRHPSSLNCNTQPDRDLTVLEAHFEKIKTCRESALPQGCPFVRGNWGEQSIDTF
jgi:hypothetical protein